MRSPQPAHRNVTDVELITQADSHSPTSRADHCPPHHPPHHPPHRRLG
ncbi:hypothetical protein [Micromonospora matsumotoense]|nr:hypothetical protein [Micromonospora matsumotoense]